MRHKKYPDMGIKMVTQDKYSWRCKKCGKPAFCLERTLCAACLAEEDLKLKEQKK